MDTLPHLTVEIILIGVASVIGVLAWSLKRNIADLTTMIDLLRVSLEHAKEAIDIHSQAIAGLERDIKWLTSNKDRRNK